MFFQGERVYITMIFPYSLVITGSHENDFGDASYCKDTFFLDVRKQVSTYAHTRCNLETGIDGTSKKSAGRERDR